MRRALRVLAIAVLTLCVLLVLVWCFRQQLLVPLLRPRLEATIAAALGARAVSIGSFEGDWLTGIDLGDLAIVATQPPLTIRGARLEASYALPALIRGDLAGLLRASMTIAEAELDLRSPAGDAVPAGRGGEPFDALSQAPLLRLLSDGASVQVGRLRLLAPGGERSGPLALELRPGHGARDLVGAFAGVDLRLRVSPSPDEPLLAARIDAGKPGELLDLFGLGAGVTGGALHAEVEVHDAPWRLGARIDLRELVHGDQRLAASHIAGGLDASGLTVERASLDLPGMTAELHAVRIPDPFGATAGVRQSLAGEFAVRVDDLSAHAALLPASWRDLLPIRGELRGRAVDGRLQLDPCQLSGRGVQLQIERGSFPLVADDWQAAEGSLRGILTLDVFTHDLPWLGTTTASGRIAIAASGSAREPLVAAELDLGACRSERGSVAGAAGTLRIGAASLEAERLLVQELRIAGIGSEAPVRARIDAGCRFRQGELDPDSLHLRLDLDSAVLDDLLTPILAARGLGAAPRGAASLHLQARHGAEGLVVQALRVRSAATSPILVVLDGEGVLPLRWTGAAVQGLEAGEFVLRTRVERPAVDAVPPVTVAGTLHFGAGAAGVRELAITAGPVSLRGEIAMARGLAALLDPAVDVAATELRGELALDAVDLATLPTAWFGGLEVSGSLAGTVRVAGPAGRLALELRLALTDGGMVAAGVPVLTAASLRLGLMPGEPAASVLLLSATGAAWLGPEFEPNRSIAFTVNGRCDENGTTLAPTTLQVGGGEVAIELASSLRHTDLRALLDGSASIGAATLTGRLGLQGFSLVQMPAAWQSAVDVRGVVDGEVELGGTLATALGPGLVRSSRLRLRDGELKVGNMPRLEHLAAEVALTPRELTLRSFTATLGAGRLDLQGSLRPRGSFSASLADAELDLRLTGEDVLLYRADGARLRATVNVAATGTLHAVALNGEVLLGRGSKFVRRLSLLPDLSLRGGATAEEGIRLFAVPPPIGDRIALDVAIQTREPFELRTYVVDGELDVAARLLGTAAMPRLEGNLATRGGTLRLPGANLRIASGLLTFSRDEPLFPRLLVQAEGKRMGITVAMAVTGRYDRPEFQLSSVPPLPPEDLLVLLTTGQLPSTLAGRGSEAQARVVGGYLAREIFESYFGSDSTEKGSSPFDRLTVESGREVSKNGVESVVVEYELLPDLAVQAERDQYEEYNVGLVLRFRFR
ncbi:MAG: translocation/assembly module TamB domain-containing protein [Planctomycetes bacterium]|nr:translocation/assembly module TamB domain-containing protein [Planctomycetota bacterium]